MIPKILVPVDDSPTSHSTIQSIIDQKERFPKNLTLLHVISDDVLAYRMVPDLQVTMFKANVKKLGEDILDRANRKLKDAGFTTEPLLEFGEPRDIIIQTANKNNYHLLVIGRHEGGGQIRDVLFGSVANHVLHNVKCPVLLF